jgi:hypothetical protein
MFQDIQGLASLSAGERKQFFAEYQTFSAKREREELRLAKQASREEFRNLLSHWSEDGELDPDITFRQLASVCCKMHFWSLLDLEEMEDIFQEFIISYESAQRHLIKERHFERKRELFRLFETRWGSSRIPPTWSDAVVFISQHGQTFSSLDDLDKFEVFEDFIMEKLEKVKEERRKSERREGRKKRDAFLHLLQSHRNQIVNDGAELMRWDDFQIMIQNDPAYVDLIGTRNSSQPYDLFSECRAKWKREDESRKRSNSTSSRDSDKKRPR